MCRESMKRGIFENSDEENLRTYEELQIMTQSREKCAQVVHSKINQLALGGLVLNAKWPSTSAQWF